MLLPNCSFHVASSCDVSLRRDSWEMFSLDFGLWRYKLSTYKQIKDQKYIVKQMFLQITVKPEVSFHIIRNFLDVFTGDNNSGPFVTTWITLQIFEVEKIKML